MQEHKKMRQHSLQGERLYDRSIHTLVKKQEKIDHLRKIKEDQELKEFTFQPKLS